MIHSRFTGQSINTFNGRFTKLYESDLRRALNDSCLFRDIAERLRRDARVTAGASKEIFQGLFGFEPESNTKHIIINRMIRLQREVAAA